LEEVRFVGALDDTDEIVDVDLDYAEDFALIAFCGCWLVREFFDGCSIDGHHDNFQWLFR
jgi:hypothetical protein